MPKPFALRYLPTILLLNLMVLCFSFAKGQSLKTPLFEPKDIIRNYKNAYNYRDYYLKLSRDFISYDTAGSIISKEVFLKTLADGGYLPLVLKSDDSLAYYQLYKLRNAVDSNYFKLFKRLGEEYYHRYKREGEIFPKFNYIDLNGNVYTNENTKGKIIVFNCWFVACSSCVFEMPRLNKLVQQYKNRNDIIFIGLDNDLKFNVINFLKTKTFNFAIVPLSEDYFSSYLKINEFPTSIIVNKKGVITKVVTNADDLDVALRKEVSE
jgi:thiol-disulfide isomerase/thioredoxin